MPAVDEKQLDRETALIQECARLITANEANAAHYAKLRNAQTRHDDILVSRAHWRTRALTAEQLVRDLFREAMKK